MSDRSTVGSGRAGDLALAATVMTERGPRGSRVLEPTRARGAGGSVLRPAAVTSRRRVARGRFSKPAAVLLTVVIVLCLIGAGGYLATRQLYFIGTNAQGVVTIYRGLPYDLPAGVHLYETFYVSGVPASLIPPDRRGALLNNSLRSESDAENVVRALELGRISK
ncbi:MAG: hypothetical protein JO321_05880 [Solirubrobacterales bacterium]|nr:hypothetical protein [Solirubrobacterales bacterium]